MSMISGSLRKCQLVRRNTDDSPHLAEACLHLVSQGFRSLSSDKDTRLSAFTGCMEICRSTPERSGSAIENASHGCSGVWANRADDMVLVECGSRERQGDVSIHAPPAGYTTAKVAMSARLTFRAVGFFATASQATPATKTNRMPMIFSTSMLFTSFSLSTRRLQYRPRFQWLRPGIGIQAQCLCPAALKRGCDCSYTSSRQ